MSQLNITQLLGIYIYIISRRYLKGMFRVPKKGQLPTPEARMAYATFLLKRGMADVPSGIGSKIPNQGMLGLVAFSKSN